MTYEELLLQNLAAESDPRTTAVDHRWWFAIRGDEALYDPDWPDGELWVKVRFVVCPLCDGRGKHVNPSIDAHGLTREDFDEDPIFAEDYLSGIYDIACNLCQGRTTIPVPTNPEFLREVEYQARYNAEARAEQLAEMGMGG